MRKIIALMAVFLLAAGLGAAAEDVKTEDGKEVNIIQEKTKLAGGGGQPTFDDLEMERGYLVIKDDENGEEYFVHVSGLIDEIRDDDEVTFELIRAGSADSARKEISVKMQDEEGHRAGKGETIEIPVYELREGRKGMNAIDVRRTNLRDDDSDGDGLTDDKEKYIGTEREEGRKGLNAVNVKVLGILDDDDDDGGIGDEVSAFAKKDGKIVNTYPPNHAEGIGSEARKGNPQTGKEIKIPAKMIGSDNSDQSASAELADLDGDGDIDAFVVNTGGDSAMR